MLEPKTACFCRLTAAILLDLFLNLLVGSMFNLGLSQNDTALTIEWPDDF
jgi:hypothetical protein